jgi:hypothetical protein
MLCVSMMMMVVVWQNHASMHLPFVVVDVVNHDDVVVDSNTLDLEIPIGIAKEEVVVVVVVVVRTMHLN